MQVTDVRGHRLPVVLRVVQLTWRQTREIEDHGSPTRRVSKFDFHELVITLIALSSHQLTNGFEYQMTATRTPEFSS